MKITDNTFYVAEDEQQMEIHDDREDAIGFLKDNADGIDPESDSVSVSEVSVDGDDWTIKQMPWQQIALELLQEG